jgi:hypothetical protein
MNRAEEGPQGSMGPVGRPVGRSRQLTSLAAVSMMAATASGRDT